MNTPWHQVRTLVAAQLRLDLRHPRTGAVRTSRALLTVGSYGFSALILALSLQDQAADTAAVLFVGLSFALVLGAFAVAGSYDELMGRPKDHAWALTLPVSERTHYVARLLSLGLFTLVMAVSMALPLAGLVATASGAATAAAAGAVLAGGMLAATFAVLAAIWGLTLLLPYRFLRTALSVLRGALIGSLVLGYQWIGTQEAVVTDVPWWPAQWLLDGLWHGQAAALLGLGLSAVVLGVLFGIVFPTRYLRLLRRIGEGEGTEAARRHASAAPNRLERLVVRAPEARAAYGFTVAALRADRLVRGRVWPAALLAFIFAVFGWWTGGLGDLFVYGAASVLYEPAVQMHLSVLVILLFCAQTIVQGVQGSDYVEAAWAYDVLPVRTPRALQLGAQQALLVRVLLPLHLALFVLLQLAMPPGHALLHVGFWFAACALVTRAQALLTRRPPFSRPADRFSMAERFVPLLFSVPAALGLLLLQVVAFASVEGAALMTTGLLVLHAGLARLVLPADAPAPAPISAPAPAMAGE